MGLVFLCMFSDMLSKIYESLVVPSFHSNVKPRFNESKVYGFLDF